MRRFLIISAGIVVVLVSVAAIGAIAIFNTQAGRQLIAGQIEKSLGDVLASNVDITSLTGALPGQVILDDISFTGPEGLWLRVDRIELQWRPFALFVEKTRIDTLLLDGAHLYRAPPDRENRKEDNDPRLIRLVNDLPSVSIVALTLSNISANINGEIERISGAGKLQMGGDLLQADIALASTNERDKIDIAIDLDPAADKLIIDATLDARAEGVIAAIAGFTSDFSFSAKNDAPLSALDTEFFASMGDYGALSGAVTRDRTALDGVIVDLSLSPGSAFSQMPELAGPVDAKLRLEERDDGGALVIESNSMAAGEVSGVLVWINRRNIVDKVEFDLSANLAAKYRPTLQEITGSNVALSGQLTRKGERYGVAATLTGKGGVITIATGETDLRKELSGDIAIALSPLESAHPPFAQALDLTARMSFIFDDALALKELHVKTEEGASLYGTAGYSFADKKIAVLADITAPPAAIAALAPSLSATDDIVVEIDLSGPVDNMTLLSLIESPIINTGANALPAATVNIALAGLPKLPTGEINGRAANRNLEGAFTLQFRASQSGRIAMPLIDYHGAGFSLSGVANYHPEAQLGDIDLVYEGDEDAKPLPGLALFGDININAAISPDDNLLTASSNSFSAAGISASATTIKADGAWNALGLSIDAKTVSTNQTGPISQIKAAAMLDLANAQSINLTTLEGAIGGSRAHLTAPARINFGNGVTIENFRLTDGSNGVIAIDGDFSAARWRAKARLRDVNIPHADGTVTLNLDLDTNAPVPAKGDFQLRSLLTEGEKAAVGGRFIWDGHSLHISNAQDSAAIDMEIVYPALMIRSPGLSVDTNGALDGFIRYDGDIGAMTPYLPPTLQSLEGALKADFTLGGRASALDISGQAQFTEGKFTEIQSGFSLIGLHIEATAHHGGDTSALRFTGGARGAGQTETDTINLSGDLTLGRGSALHLAVLFEDAELSAAPISSARLNGRVDIDGSLRQINATGALSIEELDAEIVTPESTGLVDIAVIAYDGGAMSDAVAAQPNQLLTDFEVTISADDRIFIRGRGLESEWSANAMVVNTRNGALIVGDMNLQRGALDFSGRRFDLVQGNISFDRLSSNNPLLDIRAEYQTSDGVTAIIAVTGRADEPNVELLSTPTMPSENIMALVLFGKPAEELSAVESLQTAQALAALGGVGPFGGEGITGTLRQAVGLDLLNFDLDPENGGGSLTVGKYVADGFFVSATQDAQGEAGSVRVEYEVIENLTIESELEQDGDQTVSANWKFDF